VRNRDFRIAPIPLAPFPRGKGEKSDWVVVRTLCARITTYNLRLSSPTNFRGGQHGCSAGKKGKFCKFCGSGTLESATYDKFFVIMFTKLAEF
jgi:hypothetical protein